MKKVLISLLLGVSMVTMAGCGNNNKEVANTNVEQNEREGAYPNFQDEETDEPIGLSEEEREEKAIENVNRVYANVDANFNSNQSKVESTTVCYVHNGTIHIYHFMDYTKSEYTNEEMAMGVATCYNEEDLDSTLGVAKSLIDQVRASLEINRLDVDDYEIRYHDCIGNPHEETFYEIIVIDGNGNVVELFGEKVN